jgi:hypothetical protein
MPVDGSDLVVHAPPRQRGRTTMVSGIDGRSQPGIRRLARPILLLILALLAASICILGTIHVLMPSLVGA